MRLRIKFEKTGRLKYIGHLDLLNIFNRAIKSAKLPVLYSKGFNPHMLVVFAAPLPLGITSVCEYVDIDFRDDANIETIAPYINNKFPEGLKALEVYKLAEPYTKSPSIVSRAEYVITQLEISDNDIKSFMAEDKIETLKKTKKKEQIVNIKPDIYSIAQTIDGVKGIKTILSCGSQNNLKPTLFLESLCNYLNIDTPLYKFNIERIQIFGETDVVKPLCEC